MITNIKKTGDKGLFLFKFANMLPMKKAFLLFLLAAGISCTGHQSIEDVSVRVLSSTFIYDSDTIPSCHASTLVESGGGLLAAWFGGSYESHPDVGIYCSRYDGSVWSQPAQVADGIQSDSLRYPCWNPVLFRMENGCIVLFYKVGPNPREWWGEYRLSADEGLSWGESVPLPAGMLGPIKNKPLAMPDGRILYPTSVEYTTDNWKVFVESSEKDLSDWKITPIDNNGFNAIQPTFFLCGRKLEMLCRTQEGVLASASSEDFGRSWTPLQGTDLPNNNSGIDGIVLKDGLRLLVCNPIQEGRNKLALLGSYDGHHWRTLLLLEDQPSGEFSYPAIIPLHDGTIGITYTYNRKRIKFVSLAVLDER